jgi:hypothetical protein
VARKDRAPGDLYVHLDVRAPDGDLPPDVLEALAKAYQQDVRAGLWEGR